MKIRKALLSPIILFFVLSCTKVLYDGPQRSASEISTIIPYCAGISNIDGKSVYSFGKLDRQRYHVLPGEHTLTVYLQWDSLKSDVQPVLKFTAVAGKAYNLNTTFLPGRTWKVEIFDAATNEIVSQRIE